jgi:hypothetical protein
VASPVCGSDTRRGLRGGSKTLDGIEPVNPSRRARLRKNFPTLLYNTFHPAALVTQCGPTTRYTRKMRVRCENIIGQFDAGCSAEDIAGPKFRARPRLTTPSVQDR